MDQYIVGYILINCIVFCVYGLDKYRAAKRAYRISERVLLCLAVLGILGAVAGMTLFWHKVRKSGFCFMIGLIFITECSLAIWLSLR